MKIESKELYVTKCHECCKVFRTDKEFETLCPDCIKARETRKGPKRKKAKKKILSFSEILHIAEVYNRVNHKYLHYGQIVALVEQNAEHCVCCGSVVPEGRQVCPQCEKVVN